LADIEGGILVLVLRVCGVFGGDVPIVWGAAMPEHDGGRVGEGGGAEGGREVGVGGGAGGIVGTGEGGAECSGGRKGAEAPLELCGEEAAAGGMVDAHVEAGFGLGFGLEEGLAGAGGEEGAILFEERPEANGVADGFGFEMFGDIAGEQVGSRHKNFLSLLSEPKIANEDRGV